MEKVAIIAIFVQNGNCKFTGCRCFSLDEDVGHRRVPHFTTLFLICGRACFMRKTLKNRAGARFFILENDSVIVIIIAVIFVITFAMSVIAVVTVIAMRVITTAIMVVGIDFYFVAVAIPFASHVQ